MTGYSEESLQGAVKGVLVSGPCTRGTGVIVLSGSSGRIDVHRARIIARQSVLALALQWFGGEGQSPGICEVPLETFSAAIDLVAVRGCNRVVIVGTSKGAEAALLTATIDPRVAGVMAISPSSVVWGNIGPGTDGVSWPERSSWSYAGRALNFVPAEPEWSKEYRDGLVSYRGFFEHCLRKYPDRVPDACIPVERTDARLVLVAGGDDALWPSDRFAKALADRRAKAGKEVILLDEPRAGHRILLPGESQPRSTLHAHGGQDDADARLGEKAWECLLKLF